MAKAEVPDRTAARRRSVVLRMILLAASAAVGYLLLSAGAARADDKPPAPVLGDVTTGLSRLLHDAPTPGRVTDGDGDGVHAVAEPVRHRTPPAAVLREPAARRGAPSTAGTTARASERSARPHADGLRSSAVTLRPKRIGHPATAPAAALRPSTARLPGVLRPRAVTTRVIAALPTIGAPVTTALAPLTTPAAKVLQTACVPVETVLQPVTVPTGPAPTSPAPAGCVPRPASAVNRVPAGTGDASAGALSAQLGASASSTSPLLGPPAHGTATSVSGPGRSAQPAAADTGGSNADTLGAPRERPGGATGGRGEPPGATRRTVPPPGPVGHALGNSCAAAGPSTASPAGVTTSAVCLPAPAPLGTTATASTHRQGRGVSRAPLPG